MTTLSKFNTQLKHKVLKNGSNLFLFERKGMPIHLRAVFIAGSRFDQKPGTAHFLEHLMVAGTERFPTKDAIADYIQRVGGEFMANTDGNLLRFIIEIPEKEDLSIGINVLKECLLRPLFDEKTIENERGAIISELNSKKSNPKEYIWEVARRLSMQETPISISTIGNIESVKSIVKDDLISFFKKYITSGRVNFYVSGDVDLADLAMQLEQIELPISDRIQFSSSLNIIRNRKIDIEFYPGVEQLQVAFCNRISVSSYKESCALRILVQILGGGRGSRLMKRLRYESGLVYSAFANIYESLDWGLLRIMFSCDKNNFEKAKKILSNELQSLQINNITQEELDGAKLRMIKGLKRQLQTSDAWITFHENNLLTSDRAPSTVEDFIKMIENIQLLDIDQVIKKYLLEEEFVTAICGDYK